jgi:hypothetical protein
MVLSIDSEITTKQQIASGSISQPPSDIFAKNPGSSQPASSADSVGAAAVLGRNSVDGMADAGMEGAVPVLKF